MQSRDNAVFSYVTRNENKKNRCILSKKCPAQALKLQPFVHSAQGTLTFRVHIMQYDERERNTFSRFKKLLKSLAMLTSKFLQMVNFLEINIRMKEKHLASFLP